MEFMPDHAMIARARGPYGQTVEDPAQVLPALKEALARVRAGQAAVLDVRLGRGQADSASALRRISMTL